MSSKVNFPKTFYLHEFYRNQLSREEAKHADDQFCVAYRKFKDKIELGVAFCAPNDSYVKDIGRKLASIRLDYCPVTLDIDTICKIIFSDDLFIENFMSDSVPVECEMEVTSLPIEMELPKVASEFFIFKTPIRKSVIKSLFIDDFTTDVLQKVIRFFVILEIATEKGIYAFNFRDCKLEKEFFKKMKQDKEDKEQKFLEKKAAKAKEYREKLQQQ